MVLSSAAEQGEPSPQGALAQRYTIDSARTVVSFEVRSFGIFRQRGWFAGAAGTVTLDPQADTGAFDVLVDARTIRASSDARLRIIRGSDFLNVDDFPAISYKARHVAFRELAR